MAPPSHRTFHWTDCASELEPLAREGGFHVEERGRSFERDDVRVSPPLVLPIPVGCTTLAQYLEGIPDEPARHTVILMQAGAVSLALFEGGEVVVTRTSKRYVVRGHGRSQPKHMDTKGKSRYGSRLRMQNAKRLLEETNERLVEWHEEHGPSEHVYYGGTKRLWADLFTVKPLPPFDRDDAPIKIPLDLPKPTTDVLLRAYMGLCWGRIEDRDRNEDRST